MRFCIRSRIFFQTLHPFSNTAPLAFKSLWIARDQADVWPIVCLHWGWVGMSNSPTNTRGMNYSIWIPVGKKWVYLIIFESWVHLGSLTYHFVESSGGSLQQVRSFSDHVKGNLWKSNGVLEITWKLSSSRARSPTPLDFPVFRWGGLFSFRDLEKKSRSLPCFFPRLTWSHQRSSLTICSKNSIGHQHQRIFPCENWNAKWPVFSSSQLVTPWILSRNSTHA